MLLRLPLHAPPGSAPCWLDEQQLHRPIRRADSSLVIEGRLRGSFGQKFELYTNSALKTFKDNLYLSNTDNNYIASIVSIIIC